MIDVDVIRLRRLRARALKTRAIAMALRSTDASRNLPLSRSAQLCWRIAKVVTGMLRGHPNLSYQQDYSPLRAGYDRMSAGVLAAAAGLRGRAAQLVSEELWRVARELDDTRALTWSTDLSDALGRSQLQLRGLLREWQFASSLEGRSPPATSARRPEPKPAGTWPYLAF